MGNTASTLQTPSDGGHGSAPSSEHSRSRSPSMRRTALRDHSDHTPSALSLAASSSLQQQHRLAQQRLAQQQQQQLGHAGLPPFFPGHGRASTYDAATPLSPGSTRSELHSPSPQSLLAPLPKLSHPHPQSHAYAFANQASLQPGPSAVHSHPFSNPSSPDFSSHAAAQKARRRVHEGSQGFDPTTVVSSNQATPLVATQNRHASGTPSHLEPAHPSTAFSALDVRAVEHQAQAMSIATASSLLLDRPKFQKRESGSGTPTRLETSDPFDRDPSTPASRPLPLHRPKETETSFGIGDTTLENGGFGLDVPRGIAVPGSSAVTDDDIPTPPETRKDPLGRTLPAALPSYLRIPTGDIVDEDTSLDYTNATTSPGGPDDVEDPSHPAKVSSSSASQTAGRRASGLIGTDRHRADQSVPFMAILLTWRGGGHNVSVTGTFANEWRSRIPLARNTTGSRKDRNEFSCLLHLPPGTHRLKFLVDDRWRVSPDLSTATDGEGMLVNYVEIPNVGPDHTGPLSAPGEDLPDEGGAVGVIDPRKAAEDDFRFPSAYLRASRLGKAALTQLQDPAAGLGPQSPTGGAEAELLEPGRPLAQHGKESSAAPTEDSAGLASTDELGQQQQDVLEREGKSDAAFDAPSSRSSHYAESTTSSTGASSGMTASMHHNDLKITPIDAARMDIDDDRPRGSLDDVFGDDKRKKLAEAQSWSREIPEEIFRAQMAEEVERERLDAMAASGMPPSNSHRHGHGHHNNGHHHHQPTLPAPPSLPRQLEKVILNSGPSGLAGAVDDNSVLPAPNHVVLSHLTASSIKGGVLAVGTTTRYKRKYVTTVFHRPVK